MRHSNSVICGAIIMSVFSIGAGHVAIAQTQAALPSIQEFVRPIYIHGVPYKVASRYDAKVTPDLLRMLANRESEQYWPNIVVTLGMIGDESAVEPLLDFLMQGNGKATQTEYAARSSVLLALGYLANKSDSKEALSFLIESTNPEVWAGRKVGWSSPYMNDKDRDVQLSTMAILGLGLSGRPAARDALQRLQQPSTSKANQGFLQSVSDVVETALNDNKLIAEEGMLKYTSRAEGQEFEPAGIVTGAKEAPKIVTGRDAAPPLATASMDKPQLPPKPAMRAAPEVMEGEGNGTPPVVESE
ncbi:MAG: hypothetical protein OEY04_15765 [Gammaproteobacteria bacterium]|nr:hypothetical protein [Gammaproteobacteria bacterium]